MPNQKFEAELAALDALRHVPPAEAEAPLRKALANKNNFLAAKAAKLIRLADLRQLTPALAEGFASYVEDAKPDPQCWAKQAIAEALAAFDAQFPDLFLAGMRVFQPGLTDDAAAPLRSTCALALVTCRALSSHAVLRHLTPLFADPVLSVQVNAARAVEQIGTDSAALLLKLRAELGSGQPELLGACYAGVLHLEGAPALPWAAQFLHPAAPDDASNEAAFAIADLRTEPAAQLLIQTHRQTRDRHFRETLLTALAQTRHEAAYGFLLAEVAAGNKPAREALEQSALPEEVLTRLREL